jgi:Transposase DDE domain
MLADLDLLLTAVFCAADDFLPASGRNARRRVTDAEVVTLCVAQQLMDISSDREFLHVARWRLAHLFPQLPQQPGFHKRRRRLTDAIEWLCAMFAADSPGYHDAVVMVDSTPIECGRSVETSRRSELAAACAHGREHTHARWFWGMRLHLCCALDGTPRGAILASADEPEREVALRLLPFALRGGELVVCDKGYRGRDFEREVHERFGATVLRPRRKDEPPQALNVSKLRQTVESVIWTLKDRLGLERHRARTFTGIRVRIATKLLALAAGIWLNYQTGNPARAFAPLAT